MILCAKCETDVTTGYHAAEVNKPFRCPKCHGDTFIERIVLTWGDRKFLKKLRIKNDYENGR